MHKGERDENYILNYYKQTAKPEFNYDMYTTLYSSAVVKHFFFFLLHEIVI